MQYFKEQPLACFEQMVNEITQGCSLKSALNGTATLEPYPPAEPVSGF